MRRVDERGIWQRQQFVAQRGVEQRAQVRRRPSQGRAQVGSADISDKQRVASEYRMWCVGAIRKVVDEKGNRLGCVSRSLQCDEADTAELDGLAVPQRREGILRARGCAQVDGGAGAVAEFDPR